MKMFLRRVLWGCFSSFFLIGSFAYSANQWAIYKSTDFVTNMLDFSKRAYQPIAELSQDPALSLFYEKNHENEEAAFCGFVTKKDSVLVVAFHGTRGGEFLEHDAFIDANAFTGGDGGYCDTVARYEGQFFVHKGFAREVVACYTAMKKLIQNQDFEEIVFTGHSMGGAMAQLAALFYCKDEGPFPYGKVKVFVFSSPAIFSEKARKIYHKALGSLNSVHIYVNFDIVTFPHKLFQAGVQANLSFWGRPGAVSSFFKTLKIVVVSKALNRDVAAEGMCTATAVHTIEGFTEGDINEVMNRMQTNHSVNPFMGCGGLGML